MLVEDRSLKRIVILVGAYYPTFSAVGKCIGNIANCLSSKYSVDVICLKTKPNQSHNEIYRDQYLHRISTPMYNRYFKLKDKLQTNASLDVKIHFHINRLLRFVYRLSSFPSVDSSFVRSYLQELLDLEFVPDAIICTCSPFESVSAAIIYKQSQPQCHIFPILFDLFSDNLSMNYSTVIRKIKWNSNINLERQMVENSHTIFCVSNWSHHFDKYFAAYSKKIVSIEHPLLIDRYTIPIMTSIIIGACFSTEDFDNLSSLVSFFKQFGGIRIILTVESCFDYINRTIDCDVFFAESEYDTIDICKGCQNLLVFKHCNTDFLNKICSYYILAGANVFLYLVGQEKLLSVIESRVIRVDSHDNFYRLYPSCDKSRNECCSFRDAYSQLLFDSKIKKFFCDLYKDRTFNVIFTGALNLNYVEPGYALTLFENNALSSVFLTFFSAGSAAQKVLNTSSNITLHDWISVDELEVIMGKADGFLSISEINGKQVSSKIFEYMSYGKPIIHIYYVDDDINLKYLSRYDNSLCIKASDELIQDNIQLIKCFITSRTGFFVNCSDDLLVKCKPEYVSNQIIEKIGL